MTRDYLPSIVHGSGEGIPHDAGGGVAIWSRVLGATMTNPALVYISARDHDWYVAASLTAVFLLQTIAILICRRDLRSGPLGDWFLPAVVMTTNILTYVIGYPILDSRFKSGVSFAEIQTLLCVLCLLFGSNGKMAGNDGRANLAEEVNNMAKEALTSRGRRAG